MGHLFGNLTHPFVIGPIGLDVPPENIQISRYENHQMIQYLRHKHSLKVPSGRSAVRVDISFKLVCGDDFAHLKTLQQLIAMTRVTPFVPVANAYLTHHLPLFLGEDLSEEMGQIPNAIPMAIFGMSIVAGGDSPEVLEISMSLLYWNPMPFAGGEALVWRQQSRDAIFREIESWIDQNIRNKLTVPSDAKRFKLRWYDLKAYSELLDLYPDIKARNSKLEEEDQRTLKEQSDNDTDYIPVLERELQRKADILQERLLSGQEPAISIPAISSDFGERTHPVTGEVSQHKGIDLPAKIGTPVQAPRAGQVLRTGNEPSGAGQYVVLQHSDGYETKYFHLSEIIVSRGQSVLPGDMIGRSGNTGRSTGPHVHFEVREDGQVLDPKDWLLQQDANIIQGDFGASPEFVRAAEGLDPNKDIVEQLITKFYDDERPDRTDEAQNVIRNFWHNGRLPAEDRELRNYLATTLRIRVPPQKYEEYGLTPQGQVDLNSFDKVLPKTEKPFVDPLHVQLLAQRGWRRVSDDIRPLDPLFENVGSPNELDMSPAISPETRPQQVVTALSVSFQNRFSLMPVAGWPYPTIQHMGAFDSEIRVSCALIASTESYPLFRELNRMAHSIDKRTLKYRASIYTGADVFAMTKVSTENRILNALGIQHVVMTDLQAMRDHESPELVRVEFGLTENGLVDEELFGHFNYSDQVFRDKLFEWLTQKVWLTEEHAASFTSSEDPNVGLVPFAKKILALWEAQKTAFGENKKNVDDALDAELTPEATEILEKIRAATLDATVTEYAPVRDRDLGVLYTRYEPVVGDNEYGVEYSYVPMKTGPPATPGAALYRQFLLKVDEKEISDPIEFPVPAQASDLLERSIYDWGSIAFRYAFGGLDPDMDPEYPRGLAMRYLRGNYGRNLHQAIEALRTSPPADPNTERSTDEYVGNQAYVTNLLNFLRVWNYAHHEWYKTEIIEQMLIHLSRDYEEYFLRLINEINQRFNRKAGCYRDLGLANDLTKNPYDWLDSEFMAEVTDAVANMSTQSINFVEGVLAYSKDKKTDYDQGYFSDFSTLQSYAHRDTNQESLEAEAQERVDEYQKGVDAYFATAPTNVEQALQSIKEIAPIQFTVRRAFPTFKLYFLEEDGGGPIKTFDEFYSYNAVIDWNLIEQTNRGSVLVVSLSNIFNHLDAIVLNESINVEDINKLGPASVGAGEQPITHLEGPGGGNLERGIDGRIQPLQNIALRPGAKIVLKVGYDNDPARLETIFAGQVTEIQHGDVMTIVCQGWESELMGMWDPEVEHPRGVWFFRMLEKLISANEEDPTGTVGTEMMLKAILHHPQSKHFGHWQIGSANPFDLYTWDYNEYETSQRWAGTDVKAGDRSMANIRPSQMPFYSVNGLIAEIEPVAYENRPLWDIAQSLLLRHSNNIMFVRPFGSGDATLYFGPPWGYYTSNDFLDRRGIFTDNGLEELMFEAFKQMIDREAAIYLNRFTFNEESGQLRGEKDIGPIDRAVAWFDSLFTKDTGVSLQPIKIANILGSISFAEYLFRHTSKGFQNYANRLRELGESGNFNIRAADDSMMIVMSAGRELQKGKGATDAVLRVWWDAIQEARSVGLPTSADLSVANRLTNKYDQVFAAVLRQVVTAINQEVIRNLRVQKELAEDQGRTDIADKLRIMNFLVKPVRRWHIVTSKHHIISNAIQVNTDFANSVRVHETMAQFDPGLVDVRSRYIDKNHPHVAEGDDNLHGFVAANLLAREMKKMYRGEITLTGNPDIRPHDIILVLDDVRQIYGIVEADKVVNSMSLDHGYITVVTPALATEVGDMTIAHAYQAFYTTLARDLQQLEERGGKLGDVLANAAGLAYTAGTMEDLEAFAERANNINSGKPGLPPDFESRGLAASAMGSGALITAGGGLWILGAGLALGPIAALIGGGALLVGGFTYLSWQNNSIKEHALTHPLTITPLVKRGQPWVAGLDGASGRTVVGQWGTKVVRGLRDYGKMLDTVAQIQSSIGDYRDSKKLLDRVDDGKPTTGP